jgi:hypothetical protein
MPSSKSPCLASDYGAKRLGPHPGASQLMTAVSPLSREPLAAVYGLSGLAQPVGGSFLLAPPRGVS